MSDSNKITPDLFQNEFDTINYNYQNSVKPLLKIINELSDTELNKNSINTIKTMISTIRSSLNIYIEELDGLIDRIDYGEDNTTEEE